MGTSIMSIIRKSGHLNEACHLTCIMVIIEKSRLAPLTISYLLSP